MKIAALDIGDQWTGIALSDALGIVAKPYKTVASENIFHAIRELLAQERIAKIIIGHPKTLKGTISDQTLKIEEQAAMLQKEFSSVEWQLWDERLSSKRAEFQKKNHSKEEKLRSHAIAAAFILDSYLSFLQTQKNLE